MHQVFYILQWGILTCFKALVDSDFAGASNTVCVGTWPARCEDRLSPWRSWRGDLYVSADGVQNCRKEEYGIVNRLKVTEDKSSDNRVHASGARLIKFTRSKVKHMARSSRLNATAMPRRRAQRPCLSTTSVLRHKAWGPRHSLRPASQTRSSRRASNTTSMRKHRVRGSRFNTTAVPKRKAQDPRLTLSQWLNAELKLTFQLQVSPASQL